MGVQFGKVLDSMVPSEPLVNCDQCQVEKPLKRPEYSRPYKCCSYQPFWPSFFIGEALLEPSAAVGFASDTVFLPLGAVPSWTKRFSQEQLSGPQRALTQSLKCHYFDVDRGGCSIYPYRPLECRRYICASSRSDEGPSQREHAFLWGSEILQRAFYEHLIVSGLYSSTDWTSWVSYLDPSGVAKEPSVVGRLSMEDALALYRDSELWWRQFLKSVDGPKTSMIGKSP